MSLTEKLSTIANNIPKIYNAGYQQGISESGGGGGFTSFKYATGLNHMFNMVSFPTDYVLTINDLDNVNQMSNFCYSTTGLNKIVLTGNNTNKITADYAFRGSTNLVIIDFSGFGQSGVVKFGNIAHCFRNCNNLTTILGVLDLSECTSVSSAFDYSNNLTEVRFAENSIKLNISFWSQKSLSDETVQSVINGLVDLTGGTAQSLTLHADVKAKLTDTQLDTITSKNWTLA